LRKRRGNGLGLKGETVARWLRDAGYRTVLMGKYLNGYPAEVGPSPQVTGAARP